MPLDLKQMAEGVIKSLRDYVAKAETALGARIDELDRKIDAMPAAKAGKDGENGKDGKDGENGKSISLDEVAPVLEGFFAKWALEFERRASDTLQKAVDRMPAPKNGEDGKDGADGLGFDDMDVQFDGERCISIVFTRGGVTKKFDLSVPAVIDRGIYKEGAEYSRGDGVTWAGSYWIAQDKTAAKPDSGAGWRLAVKRGRDGKDGRNGIDLTAPVKV